MGYFDGLTNASFKKDKEGNSIFYPWGTFGRGLVIPDDQSEERLRSFINRYYKVSLPSIITVGVIGGWLLASLLVPLFALWFYLGLKPLVSGYAYSVDRLTIKESCAGSAAGHSRSTLWLLLTSSGLLVLGGVLMASTADSLDRMIIGVLCTVFFGACCVAFAYMLAVKR
jgi:hypothetical protein